MCLDLLQGEIGVHDQEVLVEAIRRRINGLPVKTIARDIGALGK